jgi:23S rRNA pseudouridine1911/1915/1917 synthase
MKKDVYEVSEEEHGLRLDVFLSGRDKGLTRSQIKRMITDGKVRVNDTVAKPSHPVKSDDRIEIRREPPKTCSVSAEDIPLSICYEDESIVVVDKPAGMVVHPAAGNYEGTLVNALLFHCRDLSGIGGVLRPGIVHRLDKDTSGLLVVAKSDHAHGELSAQFKNRLVKKMYKALVYGDVKEESGVIELPIGRHPKDRKKMSVAAGSGKVSLSRWTVAERFVYVTLLDVVIETGRTHQIRVHLSSQGYPVVGDAVYGGARRKLQEIRPETPRAIVGRLKRQALHAAGIGFRHPETGRYMEFSSPLPADIASVCTDLNNYFEGRP